jgi:hypothetical protein
MLSLPLSPKILFVLFVYGEYQDKVCGDGGDDSSVIVYKKRKVRQAKNSGEVL